MITRDRSFYKKMFSIAIPVTLQSLLTISISMADTMMLGSLGEVALSAASLANQFAFVFLVLHFGMSGGAGVLTGQFWGKGDTKSIREVMSVVYRLSMFVCILFFGLSQLVPDVIISLYTKDSQVIAEGSKYLRILSIGFILHGFSLVSIGALRTVGVVKVSLVSTSISFFVNIFLNWIFIFGNFGAPALGVAGAAIGTLASRVIEFIIVVVYLFFIDKRIKYKIRDMYKINKDMFNRYIKVGSPVVGSDFVLAIGMNVLAVIMGRMGSDMVAANSINTVLYQISSIFLIGVSNSSGVIIGNVIGEGSSKKALEYGKTFMVLALALGIMASIVIFSLKGFMISFYSVSESTKAIAYQLMNSTSLLVIFASVSNVLTKGVLRAGGDTVFLMRIDSVFLWVVSIPLGFVAGLVLGLPAGVVFLCLKVDEIIKAVICCKRLLSKKWITNVTVREQI